MGEHHLLTIDENGLYGPAVSSDAAVIARGDHHRA
jgi:hypothetical protein